MSATDAILLMLNDATDNGTPAAVPVQVDPASAQVTVLDLGITRGDGIFETLTVVDGVAQALVPHLERFRHSAAMLDLDLPTLETWKAAVLQSIALHAPVHEMFVKTVLTRGIEGGSTTTGWVYAEAAGDFSSAREQGVRVVTLDRGYRHDVAKTSPWLLQGAKTLSYAVNKSVLREAERRGASDVIFVSSDGFVLEGPTSSAILKIGDTFVTPSTDQGILAGTTQASFFDFCAENGYPTEYREVKLEELADASSIWLASSVRQLAPVAALDGEPRTFDAELTAAAIEYLLSRTE